MRDGGRRRARTGSWRNPARPIAYPYARLQRKDRRWESLATPEWIAVKQQEEVVDQQQFLAATYR